MYLQDPIIHTTQKYLLLYSFMGFSGGARGKKKKIQLPVQETEETWVRSLGLEDPLEKEMATHSSILAWRITWTEEPGRLRSIESHRVDTTEVTQHGILLYRLGLYSLYQQELTDNLLTDCSVVILSHLRFFFFLYFFPLRSQEFFLQVVKAHLHSGDCIGIPCLVVLCFVVLHRYCTYYKLKVCSKYKLTTLH